MFRYEIIAESIYRGRKRRHDGGVCAKRCDENPAVGEMSVSSLIYALLAGGRERETGRSFRGATFRRSRIRIHYTLDTVVQYPAKRWPAPVIMTLFKRAPLRATKPATRGHVCARLPRARPEPIDGRSLVTVYAKEPDTILIV